MIIHSFPNGDTLVRRDRALIACFVGRRGVLSTSFLNGGYREDLKYAFNHDCKENGRSDAPLKAPSYAGHMEIVALELGLEAAYSCGMSTAADMENASVVSETYLDLTVTAAVTGGIDINGGRAGDPAYWHEPDGGAKPLSGTINIMLFIDAKLPEATLTRALVTCTEAKTAALQELLAPSRYSAGIATGSGTDGVVIVSNLESPILLTFAGKHSKLGELIGHTVIKAVKEALFRQTGLCAERQFDIFSRIGRYGITRDMLAERHAFEGLEKLSKNNELVVLTSLYVHLLDQLTWGLISDADAIGAARLLLETMGVASLMPMQIQDAKSATEEMLSAFTKGLINKLSQK